MMQLINKKHELDRVDVQGRCGEVILKTTWKLWVIPEMMAQYQIKWVKKLATYHVENATEIIVCMCRN